MGAFVSTVESMDSRKNNCGSGVRDEVVGSVLSIVLDAFSKQKDSLSFSARLRKRASIFFQVKDAAFSKAGLGKKAN